MLFQLDHIGAVLILGVLALMILIANRSNQDIQVESAQYYSGRTNMMSLIEIIEHDFRNLGAGVDASSPMILDYKWEPSDKYIEFISMVDTSVAAIPDSIKYALIPTKTIDIVLDDSLQSVQCYELQRQIYDGTTYVYGGSSIDTITELNIDLFQAGGIPSTSDLDKVRQITVKLTALSPLGVGSVIQQHRWETSFRPFNLGLKDL